MNNQQGFSMETIREVGHRVMSFKTPPLSDFGVVLKPKTRAELRQLFIEASRSVNNADG